MRTLGRVTLRTLTASCGLLGVQASGCQGTQTSAPVGESEPNWLEGCATSADCAPPRTCECGACTRTCSTSTDCAELEDAPCATSTDPAAWAQCQTSAPAVQPGLCLPSCEPGTCDSGQSCVSGACVLTAPPKNSFCASVPERSGPDRSREDEVLELVNSTRSAGAFVCGGQRVAAAPPLRLDTRLLCAARALASDMMTTGVRMSVDSMGRGTVDRLDLVGYAPTRWSESFTFGASSAARVLELLTEDPEICNRLADPGFADIAVAASGEVQVVLAAVE